MTKLIKLKKISQKKLISILISLLLIIVYRILYPATPIKQNHLRPNSSPLITIATDSAIVKRVIDGDTIQLENNHLVRYIGINTPELHNRQKPVECFAQKAFEFNKKLVEGKTVYLEKDVSETDKYKRLLRYVWIENSRFKTENSKLTIKNNKVMVNEMLVREGYAYVSTFPPDVKYATLFRQAQNEAINNNKGLWKECHISVSP